MFRLSFILLVSGLLFAAGDIGSATARSSKAGCSGDQRPDLATGDCVSVGPKAKIKLVKKMHKKN